MQLLELKTLPLNQKKIRGRDWHWRRWLWYVNFNKWYLLFSARIKCTYRETSSVQFLSANKFAQVNRASLRINTWFLQQCIDEVPQIHVAEDFT